MVFPLCLPAPRPRDGLRGAREPRPRQPACLKNSIYDWKIFTFTVNHTAHTQHALTECESNATVNYLDVHTACAISPAKQSGEQRKPHMVVVTFLEVVE
jgi:hypothetical protein